MADGAYEVASADGAVRFRRDAGGMAASGLSRSRVRTRSRCRTRRALSGLRPSAPCHIRVADQNSYPHAFEQFAQLFDHPSAPDLCVIHSASHNWADQGGHLGEHGSLGVVQATGTLHRCGRWGVEARNGRHRLPTHRCGADDVAAARGRSCPRPQSASLPSGRFGDRCTARRPGPGPASDRDSSGTGPTPTCSTTLPVVARPRTWRA